MRTFLVELTKALKARSEVLLPEAPHYRRTHQTHETLTAPVPPEHRLRAAGSSRGQHAWWQ